MSIFINALAIGGVYALVALGYNVIYVTTRVFNFAQGAIVAVAALFAYTAIANWGIPVLLVVVLCAILGMLVGATEHVVAVRPILRRSAESHMWLVSTLGV